MQTYKSEFINFLLDNKALQIGEFTLKSGRKAPYFVNTGMFYDGKSIAELGRFYAAALVDFGFVQEGDVIYGPPDKGTALSLVTASALWREHGINVRYAYRRTKEKKYGDAAGDKAKGVLVGHPISYGDRVQLLDDVFTTGDTKYDTVEFLKSLGGGIKIPGLLIAVDRQETNKEGGNSIADFRNKTKIPVKAIVTATEIFDNMTSSGRLDEIETELFDDYLKTYGIEEVKNR